MEERKSFFIQTHFARGLSYLFFVVNILQSSIQMYICILTTWHAWHNVMTINGYMARRWLDGRRYTCYWYPKVRHMMTMTMSLLNFKPLPPSSAPSGIARWRLAESVMFLFENLPHSSQCVATEQREHALQTATLKWTWILMLRVTCAKLRVRLTAERMNLGQRSFVSRWTSTEVWQLWWK